MLLEMDFLLKTAIDSLLVSPVESWIQISASLNHRKKMKA